MTTHKNRTSSRKNKRARRAIFEELELRRVLTTVTLDPSTTYQTIQGWGSAPLYPSGLSIAQVGNVMRDAGMNTVRITAGPGEFTYTTGGNLATPVALSSNIDSNIPLFGGSGMTQETDLVKWLETNGLYASRTKMIGSLWSPPQYMKISTGTLETWTNNGVQQSAYDPVMTWGNYGGNSAGGRIDPNQYTQWAEFVLSDVKAWEQMAGIPMYAYSFENEPDVQAVYNSMFMNRIAVNASDPTQGTTTGQWQLYGDALQALATQLAANPDITTKFFGPELEALGPAANNPWFLSNYYNIRQNLISRGLLGDLGAYATHDYQYAKDGDAAVWDAFWNGSAHAAQILTNGSSSVLGWLYPQQGVSGDNKEIWQTETEGEDQTWTKDGAMAYGLKIYDALVFGHVSGFTTWQLISSNPGDAWGLVDVANINNPTASYKFDAFKQFSRWIAPGSQRISAVFDNGNASIGGANSLDTYNGTNVAAFNDAQDKRLTTVFVNMQTTDQTETITIPASVSCPSYQVYETTGTQHYVQLADLVPVNGKITLTVPASSFVTVTGSYATAPPTIATAPSATPNPATGTSAALNVLGADDGGEGNLTYNWAVTGTPPAAVTFSDNGTNTAKNTTATFTKAGTYSFAVTVTDSSGQSVVGTVNVNVGFGAFTDSSDIGAPATAGSLSYTHATGSYVIAGGGADVWGTSDQFRFSSATMTGNGVAIARVNSVTNTDPNSAKAGVMFRDSSAANAAYAFAWLAPNGLVHFETRSANGASSSYSASATAAAPVWLKITRTGAGFNQFSAYFSLNGSSWTQIGTTQAITMASAALAGLGVTSHNNTAGTLNTATFDNVSLNAVPTVATAAAASPSPVNGASTALSVLGADDGGESNLTYTWTTTGTPPAPVSFSANGTNAAKNTTATFTATGTYNFLVAITDAGGLSITSPVTVTVNPPAWLGSGSVAAWNPSAKTLTVTGATSIIADPGTDEPIIQGATSAAQITVNPASGNPIHVGGISLTNGAGLTVTSVGAARSSTNYRVLVLGVSGTTTTPTFTIDSTSKLDLADNDMVFLYGTGTTPFTAVRSDIAQAYDSAKWDKPGLTSSIVQSNPANYALGYAEASTLGLSTFDNIALGGHAVLVKYTLLGDAYLAGTVDLSDYTKVVLNLGKTAANWTDGNFDYSGNVNLGDYTTVVKHMGQNLTASSLISNQSPQSAQVHIAKPARIHPLVHKHGKRKGAAGA